MNGYRAPPWLPGGDAQTIWAALFASRCIGAAPHFARERWNTADGDFIDVDRLVARGHDDGESATESDHHAHVGNGNGSGSGSENVGGVGKDTRTGNATVVASDAPLLVLFHGLEGSSSSHYAVAFADMARRRGWQFAIPHFRGCSGEANLAPRAYHSGDFEEIGWMLERFRAAHRGPIAAVGVSLGGNALMRWAEEAGSQAARSVSAVAAVSAPLDLAASGAAMGVGFNRLSYTRMFLNSMRPKALDKLAQHPGLFDRTALLAARDLHAFDDAFTAPLHGYKDADDYWNRASAKPRLADIRLPALLLNARNDPFVPSASLPPLHPPPGDRVTLWQPEQGGHVGFPHGRFPADVREMPEHVIGWIERRL
jgi:predicted alpha/beta-fold hydrolase